VNLEKQKESAVNFIATLPFPIAAILLTGDYVRYYVVSFSFPCFHCVINYAVMIFGKTT
jgi:hypothetical protein